MKGIVAAMAILVAVAGVHAAGKPKAPAPKPKPIVQVHKPIVPANPAKPAKPGVPLKVVVVPTNKPHSHTTGGGGVIMSAGGSVITAGSITGFDASLQISTDNSATTILPFYDGVVISGAAGPVVNTGVLMIQGAVITVATR